MNEELMIEKFNVTNELFEMLDALVDKYNLQKLKSTSNVYVVAGGIPKAQPDHAYRVGLFALEAKHTIDQFHLDHNHWYVDHTACIHSGPVMAGVTGNIRTTYDIWGGLLRNIVTNGNRYR
jgi:adenylate cyclase